MDRQAVDVGIMWHVAATWRQPGDTAGAIPNLTASKTAMLQIKFKRPAAARAPVTVLYLVWDCPKRTRGLRWLTSGMSAGVGAPGVTLGSPVTNDTSIS